MLAFLKLILAVAIVIVVLIVVAFYVIKKKLKAWWSGVMENAQHEMASGVPPFRIRLQRQEGDDPNLVSAFLNPNGSKENAKQVEELSQQLLDLKYTRIGNFYAHEALVGINAFQHHDHQVFAVVYDHCMAGVWCDQFRRYADKTSWTYANKADDLGDRPPWSNTKFFPDASLEEILQALLNGSPNTGFLKSGANQFVKAFEAHYAREMNWRIQRGGASESEIRRIAERDGIEVTDEDVLRVQQSWKVAISDFLSQRMVENWKSQSAEPNETFEAMEHRMVGIHKRMTPKQILAAVDESYFDGAEEPDADLDEEEDLDVKKWRRDLGMVERACGTGSPVAVFHAFLKKRDLTKKYQLLGTVDRPIKGEIWLKPVARFEEAEHEGIDVADYDDIESEQ